MEHARLYSETQHRVSELKLLHDVALAAAPGVRVEETLQAAAVALTDKIEDIRVSIMLQDPERFVGHMEKTGKELNAAQTLNWWREERSALLDLLGKMNRKDRLSWYGPDMSAISFATARLMETWAHGQDIVDALGIVRKPTDRLRHIAHMGVSTFAWSYAVRQMEVPDTPVRVELTGPSGDLWTWGPEEAKDRVKGPAEDFCLVAVQRRHFSDTNLIITGDTARQWISIAQAYAGPAGSGRKPGLLSGE